MRLLKGLSALALMVFVLAGIPTLLWFLGGNPLPTGLPSADLLTQPTDIGLFLKVVTFAGWIAWATLAWAIIVELIAAMRGVTITPPKALAWQHGSARSLVGGVMLLGALGAQIGGTAIAGAAPATGPDSAPSTQYIADLDSTITSTATTDAPEAAINPAKSPQPQTVTTERGDTLWDLAETHLGDGHRWTEIRDLNPDTATGPFLSTGATLTLPATATTARPGEVTVVDGDCLWDLAETHLGDSYRWTEIRDANPAAVHGPGSVIYIGTHLAIPTGASQAPAEAAPEVPAPQPSTPETSDPDPIPAAPATPGPDTAGEQSPTPSAAPESPTETDVPSRSESGRHEGSGPASSSSVPSEPETSSAPPSSTTSSAQPTPSSAPESSSTQTDAPSRSEGGRHDLNGPDSSSSTPSEPAPAPAETAPPESTLDSEPVPAEPAPPESTTAPAETVPSDSETAPTETDDVEGQAARILEGLSGADSSPSTSQSQELPPPPPPAPASPSAIPSPPPSDPSPTPEPEESVAGIGSVSVAPQPEAAPGSDEAQRIAEQATAAAAEYGLGASPGASPMAAPAPVDAAPAPAQSPSSVDADPDLASTELNDRTTTVAGLSAVALLGVISIVQLYRRRQQHDRRRGEAIALPADDVGEVLVEANAAVDPVVLADVDLVLRHLDDCTRHLEKAPQVVGVTVTERTVDVAIATDVELPAPWALVDGAWSVAPRDLPSAPHALVSPWPSLAAVGTTAAGDPFLLNLEDVGHLSVSAPGDRDLARHIMQAMAVELAVSPIADGDLHVHLVGLASDLPDVIDNGRLDYCDDLDTLLDRLERYRHDHDQALAADGLATTAHARRAWASSDYTAPHIVLCATELTATQQHRMGELARSPRFAAAAVTAQPAPIADGWVLEATDRHSAQLHTGAGGGLAITPAPLTDADLAAVIEVLAAAQRPSVPATDAEPVVEPVVDESTHDELTSHPDGGHPAGGVDILVGAPAVSAPMWAAEEVEASLVDTAPMPRLVDPLADSVVDETVAVTSTDEHEPESPEAAADEPVSHIWLHLLGEPKVTPLNGETAPENREARLTELAALLHLEGELTHTQIDERLWPRDPQEKISDPTERARKKKDRRQQFFSRLRRWMGETAGGDEAFPKVGGRYSDIRYHLHPDVLSDWQQWQQLVPRLACEATTDGLVEAMAMVRGTPLARHSARVTTYGWADDYRQDMISRITDAAEELAARLINDGSVADALDTALLGLDVCTAREGLWRMAIISTHGLGGPSSREQTQHLIDRMLTEMAELEIELEPQTTELLALLDQLHTDEGDPLYDISAEAS